MSPSGVIAAPVTSLLADGDLTVVCVYRALTLHPLRELHNPTLSSMSIGPILSSAPS